MGLGRTTDFGSCSELHGGYKRMFAVFNRSEARLMFLWFGNGIGSVSLSPPPFSVIRTPVTSTKPLCDEKRAARQSARRPPEGGGASDPRWKASLQPSPRRHSHSSRSNGNLSCHFLGKGEKKHQEGAVHLLQARVYVREEAAMALPLFRLGLPICFD